MTKTHYNHYSHESEPSNIQDHIAAALGHLLGEGGPTVGVYGGEYVAKLLYEATCDPAKQKDFLRVVSGAGKSVPALSQLVAEKGDSLAPMTPYDFIYGLSSLIENADTSDVAPHVALNAMEFASRAYEGWEELRQGLSPSLRQAIHLADQHIILGDEQRDIWLKIKETGEELLRQTEADSKSAGANGVIPKAPKAAVNPDDKRLQPFRDLIRSMDLSDFKSNSPNPDQDLPKSYDQGSPLHPNIFKDFINDSVDFEGFPEDPDQKLP